MEDKSWIGVRKAALNRPIACGVDHASGLDHTVLSVLNVSGERADNLIVIPRHEHRWEHIEPTYDYAVFGHQLLKFQSAFLDEMMGFCTGHDAGLRGEPRDWKRGNNWHRGYLRGRLQRYRETGRMWL